MLDWQLLTQVIPKWLEVSRKEASFGKVATYIPGLAAAPQHTLGISVIGITGEEIHAGDCGFMFTLQSISKVFSLLLALIDAGENRVFEKVGMEPTGDDFNSILKLELVDPGKPFNPFINAGAIMMASLIGGNTPEEKSNRLLRFTRRLAGDESLTWNESVYESERKTAHRNRSLAYFLKDNGVLLDDVEDTLEVYFRQCAIEVNAKQLARMGMILVNDGKHPTTGEQLIPRRYIQITKTFMVTCGMYNGSGEFAIQVGLPAKSGVSGGILALIPGQAGLSVIGPSLETKGNSIAGLHLLKTLSHNLQLSMF
ncbi:glutaminase A [Paenibacillus aquistagni]|uniref:Glutaminase n=1 Tax=Paenibacillus aquistagni TaxID=1852522 RepID=A0A1X7ISE1_9BACL|nr:glutaminase A [Paenibacillus aquistagni]SMG17692.1 L-glutaminase [Paenibacillus aquistagni]